MEEGLTEAAGAADTKAEETQVEAEDNEVDEIETNLDHNPQAQTRSLNPNTTSSIYIPVGRMRSRLHSPRSKKSSKVTFRRLSRTEL